MSNDKLPEVKEKKLIKVKDFIKLAEKVKRSFDEELNYLREKNEKNGNNTTSRLYKLS